MLPLICIILSVGLLIAYGVLFLRPRYRILSAALVSAAVFLLYFALYLAAENSEAVGRLSAIMLGVTGLATIALAIGHVIFERGAAGKMTGTRKTDAAHHSREYTP